MPGNPKKRKRSRPTPRAIPYRADLRAFSADAWNRSSLRGEYAESSCPEGEYVVYGETTAAGRYADQGVAIVARFAESMALPLAVDRVLELLFLAMDDKVGPEFWRPEGTPHCDVAEFGAAVA